MNFYFIFFCSDFFALLTFSPSPLPLRSSNAVSQARRSRRRLFPTLAQGSLSVQSGRRAEAPFECFFEREPTTEKKSLPSNSSKRLTSSTKLSLF